MRCTLPTPGQQLLADAARHANLLLRVCQGYIGDDGQPVYCGAPLQDERPFAQEVTEREAGLSHGICPNCWREVRQRMGL